MEYPQFDVILYDYYGYDSASQAVMSQLIAGAVAGETSWIMEVYAVPMPKLDLRPWRKR